MSSVTSAHRLPPANPVDRDIPDMSWAAVILSAVGIVAFLWLFTCLVGAL